MNRTKSALLNACLRLLRPLARILLRHGLSTYDFTRIANIAFVRAARDILREQGKPLSFSRVSTITGLHRHVVSDIVNSADVGSAEGSIDKDYRRNRLARVLSGWYESPEFTDGEGRPLPLSVDGPKPSFASLVRAFSGDIYPKIILDELLESGAAIMLKDGKVRVMTRRYTTGGAEPAAIEHLGSTVCDHLATLEHNLATPIDARLYDDSVVSLRLDSAALPLFRRLVKQRGSAFLEDIDGWVVEHENPDAPDTVRAGVMIQMFVETEPDPVEISVEPTSS